MKRLKQNGKKNKNNVHLKLKECRCCSVRLSRQSRIHGSKYLSWG